MVSPVRRVVLVIAEGLQPEAMPYYSLFNLRRVVDRGTTIFSTEYVEDSSLASRLASLCTGVHPDRHGVSNNRTLLSRTYTRLEPLGQTISSEGFQASVFGPDESCEIRARAMLLGRELGFQHVTLRGTRSSEIVSSAIGSLCSQRRGLIVLRFPECAACEPDGWASPAYAASAQRLDQALGSVLALSGAGSGDSLLMILGDHRVNGKGAWQSADHRRRLTLTLFGRGVYPQTLENGSILDVAPTILWSLGLAIPRHYEGRPLLEAFGSRERAMAMA